MKDLIEELEELRLMLDKANTERYTWFKNNSENGADCKYARMAADIFERDHTEAIQKKLAYILSTFY